LNIVSTFGPGSNLYRADFWGTSAATPHVAGAVALLAAANPAANPQHIKTALLQTVDLVPAFTNRMSSHGRLNLGRAIDHSFIASGPPFIARRPLDQSVPLGGRAEFAPIVFGEKPRASQWCFNGAPISGATNATLTLANAQLARDGLYSVRVSNRLGVATSEAARLTVLVNPTINLPPISQSVAQGGSVTFSAGFTGNPPPFGVEWRQGSLALASNTVAGFQDFFLLTNAQPAHAGTWRVRVRNAAGSTGVERTFTLAVLPDSDGDGLPNAWELAHGLRTNDASDGVLDADFDRVSNRDEYLAGTNPTNGQSFPWIETIRRTNAATVLGFRAASNKTYTVEAHGSAEAGAWSRLADVPAATTNRMVSVTDAGSEAARHYRLVTPRRP
jgi:hypothetical protein